METAIHAVADALIATALRFALVVEALRKFLTRRARKLRGSLASLRRRWPLRRGLPVHGFRVNRRCVPHNRTPAHLEEQVVRLHVEQPQLGAGQLRFLAARLLGLRAHWETLCRMLLRRKDVVVAMEQEWRRRRRRIRVSRRNFPWGIDLTLTRGAGSARLLAPAPVAL